MQAFHVFHTSCLIHWILLCEVEIANQSTSSKVRRRSRRKTAAKCNGQDGQMKALSTQIYSVFCPECQGTGAIIDGDDLEKPNLPLSQVCTLQDNFLIESLSYYLYISLPFFFFPIGLLC